MRRQFDSPPAGLCTRQGAFGRSLGLELARPLEAVELARTFSADQAVAFVNGVLDAVHRGLADETATPDPPSS